MRLWRDWVIEKNKKLILSTISVPAKSFHEFTDEELIKWIPYFLVEIRTRKKETYRALSYLEFCLCLQSYLRLHKRNCRFLVDPKFTDIRNASDNVMKVRQREGKGNNPKKADVVSYELEKLIFDYLDDCTPKKLVVSLIYLLGINLMLRSGEHRGLSRKNFEVDPNGEWFIYTEFHSKNNQGGLAGKNRKLKKITIKKSNNPKLVEYFLKYYKATSDKSEENFYYTPKKNCFTDVPIGVHTIGNYMKEVFGAIGAHGYYTLRSLRRTGITRMFNGFMPEKVIQEFSGHTSTSGLREYEMTSEKQLDQAAKVLVKANPEKGIQGFSGHAITSGLWESAMTSEKQLDRTANETPAKKRKITVTVEIDD